MRSAVDFLPSSMTLLITWATSLERWTGSASRGRIWAAARRGMFVLFLFHAVHRARLLAIADAGGVEGAAHDLVAHAGQVLDATAPDENHGVLLQVVPLAGNVGGDFHRPADPYTRDLAQRGVGLLRRGCVDARADAAALRGGGLLLTPLTRLQAGGGELFLGRNASLAHEL